MSKYYTPKLNEFHIGFEYEIIQLNEYGRYTNEYALVSVDDSYDFNGVWDIFNSGRQTNIRVKYLNKEDILSTGFEQYKIPWQFRYKHYKLHTGIYKSNEDIPQDRITILDSRDSHCYFDGIIKNKSELNKVLIMIGVKDA